VCTHGSDRALLCGPSTSPLDGQGSTPRHFLAHRTRHTRPTDSHHRVSSEGSRSRGHEVARERSPDGAFDAFLLEIDKDSEEGHSYRVCLRPPKNFARVTLANCDEIAYVGGVSGIGGGPPVTLVWIAPSQLEIRYANATAIHIYKPVFVWGRGLYRRLPVFTTAVQTETQPSDASSSAR
jgi:hypothetical protein